MNSSSKAGLYIICTPLAHTNLVSTVNQSYPVVTVASEVCHFTGSAADLPTSHTRYHISDQEGPRTVANNADLGLVLLIWAAAFEQTYEYEADDAVL